MNSFLNELNNQAHLTTTENGAITRDHSGSYLLDMFANGGACRKRSAAEIERMFSLAFAEDPIYALKCLFYLRDVTEGQGERRFFHICLRWLANNEPEALKYNMFEIPNYGRWEDLYALDGTPLEASAYALMYGTFMRDIDSSVPTLLGKWLKSCNASSAETCYLGKKTAAYFGLSEREYRKSLSYLRSKINIVERLMSEGKWDQIDFSKLPSRAGMQYREAFKRHCESYEAFAADKTTKVNASVLYPFDVVKKCLFHYDLDETDRQILDKYWANLKDIYQGRQENAIAVVDVSGSMYGNPINASIGLGLYVAERSGGAFKDHFITFSEQPELVRVTGNDIYSKIRNCGSANWGMNTNIHAVFNLLLNAAKNDKVSPEDMPERIYIFSDMEFDYSSSEFKKFDKQTLFENIEREWTEAGYKMPHLVFWNLNSRQNNIPAINGYYSYVSGFSPSMIDAFFSGKSGYSLMMEKLNSERYKNIK